MTTAAHPDPGRRGHRGGDGGVELLPGTRHDRRHPAVCTGWTRDVYITLLEVNDAATAATLRVAVNPLIAWIWAGGVLMTLGGALAGWPARRRSRPVAPGDGPGTSTEPAEPAGVRRGEVGR